MHWIFVKTLTIDLFFTFESVIDLRIDVVLNEPNLKSNIRFILSLNKKRKSIEIIEF